MPGWLYLLRIIWVVVPVVVYWPTGWRRWRGLGDKKGFQTVMYSVIALGAESLI